MRRSSRPPSALPLPADFWSRWGLPRNFVVSLNRGRVPDPAEAWLATRVDLLDAYRAGLVERKRYDREKARLDIARRSADVRYERALRKKGGR